MLKSIKSWFSSTFSKKWKTEEPNIRPKSKPKPQQKQYISKHAKIRFEERHGIVFTNDQARSIVEDIISERAFFVQPQHDNTEEWVAEYQGKKYRVIYAVGNKMIITVYSGLKNKTKKPTRKRENKSHGRLNRDMNRKPKAYKRKKYVIYDNSLEL